MASATPESEEEPSRSAEGSEEYEWLRTPAIFCDTFVSSVFRRDRVVRIAFGEYTGRGYFPFYRTSVTMPIGDARALVRVLDRQLKEADEEARIARETRAAKKEPSAEVEE